jgi:hypothetical protein
MTDRPQVTCPSCDSNQLSIRELVEEITDLKSSVVAFAGPWAVQWAEINGLPKYHLHPQHYDILEQCGARMTDFIRAVLAKRKHTGAET